MTEIIARREFSPLYIAFDIAFLVLYGCLLLRKKKYMTFLVGFLAGILYMAVDYGIFHLVCHSRSISDGLATSHRPASVISNTPISFVDP